MTDFEGNFSMVVKNTANELEISYIGYKTQRLKIGTLHLNAFRGVRAISKFD